MHGCVGGLRVEIASGLLEQVDKVIRLLQKDIDRGSRLRGTQDVLRAARLDTNIA